MHLEWLEQFAVQPVLHRLVTAHTSDQCWLPHFPQELDAKMTAILQATRESTAAAAKEAAMAYYKEAMHMPFNGVLRNTELKRIGFDLVSCTYR